MTIKYLFPLLVITIAVAIFAPFTVDFVGAGVSSLADATGAALMEQVQ